MKQMFGYKHSFQLVSQIGSVGSTPVRLTKRHGQAPANLFVQLEIIYFPLQMTNDPGMFENPFRDGGDLSKDADVIIDALKTGKLSVISNVSNGTPDLVLEERDVMDNSDHVEKNGGGMLVEPRERKNGQNGEVDVQRGLVVNTKQAAVERVVIDEKKQKCKCCVLQ